ncbi:MAG: twin-arginine translocase TatA/TatE family subunit [Acidimicrobiia bacterium]|nr:twin-arginine translocase TatA/TatE family subunit [Acidimicrobiia bacterium]
MFGIQTSELLVIALVAILLFGPERVPEFFHRAGQVMSKLQRSADDLWTSIQTEMNQTTKPLEDLGGEIKALGDTMKRPLGTQGSPDQAEPPGSESAGPDEPDAPTGDGSDGPPETV